MTVADDWDQELFWIEQELAAASLGGLGGDEDSFTFQDHMNHLSGWSVPVTGSGSGSGSGSSSSSNGNRPRFERLDWSSIDVLV